MNVLFLGDVVSQCGCEYVRKKLPAYKRFAGVDLCIANAENSAKGNGGRGPQRQRRVPR